jgi:PilZ domain-containing protein
MPAGKLSKTRRSSLTGFSFDRQKGGPLGQLGEGQMAFGKLIENVEKFVERRADERSRIEASGRLMLADRRECPCTITNASLGGAAVLARESGAVGEPVVIYVDDVGRVQGEIVRVFEGGFAIRLTAASRAVDALMKKFAYA